RAEQPIDAPRVSRLSLNTGIEPEDIIPAPDVPNIYQIPLDFEKFGLTERIIKKLKLKRKNKDLKQWGEFVKKAEEAKTPVKIGIVGKYFASGAGVLT